MATKNTMATSPVCRHCIMIHIKTPATLPIITFANVENTEQAAGEILELVWKVFWLYRAPEGASDDTKNLQSTL